MVTQKIKNNKMNKTITISETTIKSEIEKRIYIPTNFTLIAISFFSNFFIFLGLSFWVSSGQYSKIIALGIFFLSFSLYFYLFTLFTLYGILKIVNGFKKFINLYIAIFIVIFIILTIIGAFHYFEGMKGIVGLCVALLAGGLPYVLYEIYKKHMKK
jgi:hypothetical protein